MIIIFFRTLYAECRRVDEEQEIFYNFFVNQRRLLAYSSNKKIVILKQSGFY
jgi:hypothetical protein